MRRLSVASILVVIALAVSDSAGATTMATATHAVDAIQRDILAWKQAGVAGRVDAVAAACTTLAKHARADLSSPRPRRFRKKLWSEYRRGMSTIAAAAAHCSTPDPTLSLAQFVERDGRAIADGEADLVDAITRAHGYKPQD
jgi:hypothetical protein